jgi:uncharacterized protein YaaR (DUF327 family)
MVLRGHENDLEFIETLLDEQKTKSMKLPLSVFLKIDSMKSIFHILNQNDMIRLKAEQKVQLTKRESFQQIVTNKKEEMFMEHIKSKQGDSSYAKNKLQNEENLREQIFRENNAKESKTELERLMEKFRHVHEYLEEEEFIGEVQRHFRGLVRRRTKGGENYIDELLKGFRKMRKLVTQGKISLVREKELFGEIERLYNKCIENLDKKTGSEDKHVNQVSEVGSLISRKSI